MNLVPLAILLVVGSGTVAGFLAYEASDSDDPPRDACLNTPLTAATGGDGLIRFVVTNHGDGPRRVQVCAMTKQHVKVAAQEVDVPTGGDVTVDFHLPVGTYFVRVESVPVDGLHHNSQSIAYLRLCPHFAAQYEVGLVTGGGGSNGAQCFDPGTGAPQQDWLEYAWSQLTGGSPERQAVGAGLGASTATGLLILARTPIYFGFLLFTRLRRPKVLDQVRRGQIHDLVDANPGIHANAIAKQLRLARGEAQYHLHVLVRERMLARVHNWGTRNFFIVGRYSPAEMRARAALRSQALGRLYGAIVQSNGAPLSDVARASGYSLARASRLARRLEEVGLVERAQRGRAVYYCAKPSHASVPPNPSAA